MPSAALVSACVACWFVPEVTVDCSRSEGTEQPLPAAFVLCTILSDCRPVTAQEEGVARPRVLSSARRLTVLTCFLVFCSLCLPSWRSRCGREGAATVVLRTSGVRALCVVLVCCFSFVSSPPLPSFRFALWRSLLVLSQWQSPVPCGLARQSRGGAGGLKQPLRRRMKLAWLDACTKDRRRNWTTTSTLTCLWFFHLFQVAI
jgi:hypothetical protein